MKKLIVNFMIITILLLGSCVSYQNYDEWLVDKYEPGDKELEIYNELKNEYENIIEFNSSSDLVHLGNSGIIDDGVHYFKASGESEFQVLKFSPDTHSFKKIGICVNATTNEGFIEVFLGSDGGEKEITLRPVGQAKYKFPASQWSLIEFEKAGTGTMIFVNGKLKYEEEFHFTGLTFFYFGKGSAKIDYILYN